MWPTRQAVKRRLPLSYSLSANGLSVYKAGTRVDARLRCEAVNSQTSLIKMLFVHGSYVNLVHHESVTVWKYAGSRSPFLIFYNTDKYM